MRLLSSVFAFALALSATGCAYVQSDVSVFHEMPTSASGIAYALLRFKEQESSLEHKAYEDMVRQQLNSRGLIEVPADKADVIAFIQYGIDSGRDVAYSYPIFGQTGVSSSYTTGTVQQYGSGYARYSGTTTYTPTYGVTGSGVASERVYGRFLRLDLLDRQQLVAGNIRKKYEARVISSGTSSQLSRVMPAMVQALFAEFPGKSGSTRTVRSDF